MSLKPKQLLLSHSFYSIYICTFQRVTRQGTTQSHSVSREPGLPTYVGILVHAKTRMEGLIDKLFDQGLSIPYCRVIAISTNLGNQILPLPESYASVSPLVMLKHDPISQLFIKTFRSHALIAEAMEKEQQLVHCVFYKLITIVNMLVCH